MEEGRGRPVFARGVPLPAGLVLKLPESGRDRLAAPFAEVFEGAELAKRVKGKRPLAAVGDVTAAEAVHQKLAPRIIVVDFKTKRGPVVDNNAVRAYGTTVARVACPAGHMTAELYNAVLAAASRTSATRIEVEGEEDLAVMPAIIHLAPGATVIYGLPDRGITAVAVNDESRCLARDFLESFVEIPSK